MKIVSGRSLKYTSFYLGLCFKKLTSLAVLSDITVRLNYNQTIKIDRVKNSLKKSLE